MEYNKGFYILIMGILLTDIVILLNIPFLRQILGFLFLTVLPGLLIIPILKLNKLVFLEKFILSWGLSISFLMLFGLLVNNLSLSLGYETPLATIPLLIIFNIVFIGLVLIGCKTNKEPIFAISNLNLTTPEKAFLIVPILFPALSVFGMHVMNTTDNNILLMFMLFLIPIYVAFVCFLDHKFPKRLYPIVIFLISISLLLLLSLRSNHLIGSDVHDEYYLFQTTLDNLHWCIGGNNILDTCVSISLLPTIYQSILNTHSEYLFKILYSVLCSVFPLVIYAISKKYVEEGYAFLASIYFISNATFLWTEYNARANLAMLFFAIAMMVLFSDRIESLKKRILFIVFMASCVVSHYTNAYTFFFVMLGTFIGMEVLSKGYKFKKVVSLTTLILFFAFIFFWYSQVTEVAFNIGVRFMKNSFDSLYNLAVIEARSESAQLLLGGVDLFRECIVYRIHWLLTWLAFAFIAIGLVTLIIRYKEMSFPELNVEKPNFLKAKFEVGYFMLSLVLSGLLVMVLLIPFISKGYGLGRSYPLASTILSVFFVIGGIIIAKILSLNLVRKVLSKQTFKKSLTKNASQLRGKKALLKKPFLKKKNFTKRSLYLRNSGKNTSQVRAYLIILVVLIPYFLCVTGAMYNISDCPHAITLNSEGKDYDMLYIHDQDSYGMRWLGRLCAEEYYPRIYVAPYGGRGMLSQGKISNGYYVSIGESPRIHGRYIYLGYYNIVKNKIVNSTGVVHNMTEYSDRFDEWNKVYNNGGSEIWE